MSITILSPAIVILAAYIFYPRNIYQKSGTKYPFESKATELRINHKQNILATSNLKLIANTKRVEDFSEFISNYKFRILPFSNYKEFDDHEFYYFSITLADETILSASIIDKKYLLLTNRFGLYKMYQAVNQEIDTEFIENILNAEENITL